MKTNYFKDIYDLQAKDVRKKQKNTKIVSKHISEIERSFRGNRLSEFIDDENSELCKQFIDFMKQHNFAGSAKLKLVERKRPRTSLVFRQKTLWSGKGYPIGVLTSRRNLVHNSANSAVVFLCTDTRLRCQRSRAYFDYFSCSVEGVGTLPKSVYLGEEHIFEPGVISGDVFDTSPHSDYLNRDKLVDVLSRLMKRYLFTD